MTRHHACTCPTPCQTPALHMLRKGEQRAVETMRVLLEAMERVAWKMERQNGGRP